MSDWNSILSLAWAIAALSSQASTPPQAASWSERGIFVFAPEIVLDFGVGAEVAPSRRPPSRDTRGHALEDCSTPEALCARGEVVRIALPRHCSAWNTQREFAVGDVRTVVLREDDMGLPLHHAPGGTRYLLGDPARPQIIYEYYPSRGVTRIAYAWYYEHDLAEIARSGEYDAFLERETDNRRSLVQRTVFNLITFDPFGPCED